MSDFTRDEFETWVPARKVYADASKEYGTEAAKLILDRLSKVLMLGRAENFFVEPDPKLTDLGFHRVIPIAVWKHFSDYQRPFQIPLWNTNGAEVEIHGSSLHSGPVSYKLFGIRFDPAGVKTLMPPVPKPVKKPPTTGDFSAITIQPENIAVVATIRTPAPPPPPAPMPPPPAVIAAPLPPPSRAGRPTKDFWEDMVIAATRAILFDDTLKPKTQADVAKWMADWAIAKGYGHPGETALKERARKVFLACQT